MSDRSDSKSQIIAFFLTALGFTWAIHFSIKLLGIPFALDLSSPGMSVYLIGLAGPLVSAVLVSAYWDGSAGLRSLFGKGLKWRFPLRWYLFAILVLPAINVTNLLVFYDRIAPDFAWFVVNPILIGGQIWVVVAEEFGWRGFALPRLQSLYGSLGATLIIGPIWAMWHLPMFFIPGSPQYSENVPASLLVYTLLVVCISVMLTAVYNRTNGSVLACMLFHAFLNIAAFTIQVPAEINITIYLILGVAVISIFFLDRPFFRRS